MKLQVTSRTSIYANGKRLQAGDVFEVDGDIIPKVYQGSVRVVGEEIVSQTKAKKGHVLLRVTSNAPIYRGTEKHVKGDIIEVPEGEAEHYQSHTMPADQPMPLSSHGHMPMHAGGGVN